jgi:hypothetical protein
MAMTSIQPFQQPTSATNGKGLCLRLAVKWAVTRLCGGTATELLSSEEWLKAKTAKALLDGGSKGYTQYSRDLDEAFGPIKDMVLKSVPTTGVEHSRWKSADAKQAQYAQAIKETEAKQAPVRQVDLAYVQQWSSKIASRYGKNIAVQQISLDSVDNWVGVALAKGSFPAQSTLVLGYDFANDHASGGHALAYADPLLFDPNGGVFRSDMEAAAFRFADLDQYVFKKYGKSLGADCYVITLGG